MPAGTYYVAVFNNDIYLQEMAAYTLSVRVTLGARWDRNTLFPVDLIRGAVTVLAMGVKSHVRLSLTYVGLPPSTLRRRR